MKKLLLIAAVSLLASTAHARVGADDWVAVPYNNDGLVVNSKSLELKKGKMWIQIQLVNNTGKMMTFNPDQIQAKLPDGNVVTRLLLPLSLGYDHRVIDGAAAARFTTYLASLLADFRRVLL